MRPLTLLCLLILALSVSSLSIRNLTVYNSDNTVRSGCLFQAYSNACWLAGESVFGESTVKVIRYNDYVYISWGASNSFTLYMPKIPFFRVSVKTPSSVNVPNIEFFVNRTENWFTFYQKDTVLCRILKPFNTFCQYRNTYNGFDKFYYYDNTIYYQLIMDSEVMFSMNITASFIDNHAQYGFHAYLPQIDQDVSIQLTNVSICDPTPSPTPVPTPTPSPFPTPSPDASCSKTPSPTTIIGLFFAFIAVFALGIGLGYWWMKRQRSHTPLLDAPV